MPLKLQIDAADIASSFKQFAKEVEADLKAAMKELATLTRAQIHLEVTKGEDKLETTRKIYLDNLSDPTSTSPGVWVITLDEPALWIEEGAYLQDHDMKPKLLAGGKNPGKYRVIPFKYNTKPAETTPGTQLLIDEIQKKLRSEKISYSKIDYHNGDKSKPVIGKIHDLKWGTQIPGGNKIPGRGNTMQLERLSIYQRIKDGNVRRDILTFRTVSAGPKSDGKWIHPGSDGKKYMDKAFEAAEEKWEKEILPEIMKRWEQQLK